MPLLDAQQAIAQFRPPEGIVGGVKAQVVDQAQARAPGTGPLHTRRGHHAVPRISHAC